MAWFTWADYLVFFGTLLLSAAVGIYCGIRHTKGSVDDYLMAGREMGVIPVTCSLGVTMFSALYFLGDPVDVYLFGILYWVVAIFRCVGLAVMGTYIAPLYHKKELTSMCEVSIHSHSIP